jgi:transposase
MQSIMTIGLDIAKSVFQVHGVDADGQVVIRRQSSKQHVLRKVHLALMLKCRSSGTWRALCLWRHVLSTSFL